MPPPILLLKTKSSPNDAYDDYFSATKYAPIFVPVLEHRFHSSNLTNVRELFASGAFNPVTDDADTQKLRNESDGGGGPSKRYGGMIFTSQRAVEGFAKMIEEDGRTFTQHTTPHHAKGREGKEAKLTRYSSPIYPLDPPLHCRSSNSTNPLLATQPVPPRQYNPRRGNRYGREPGLYDARSL